MIGLVTELGLLWPLVKSSRGRVPGMVSLGTALSSVRFIVSPWLVRRSRRGDYSTDCSDTQSEELLLSTLLFLNPR